MEKQRKDVKSLLYSRRLLMMMMIRTTTMMMINIIITGLQELLTTHLQKSQTSGQIS